MHIDTKSILKTGNNVQKIYGAVPSTKNVTFFFFIELRDNFNKNVGIEKLFSIFI